MRIGTAWNDADRTLSLRLAEGSQLREPMPRRIMVRVAPDDATREIVFDGSPLDVRM